MPTEFPTDNLSEHPLSVAERSSTSLDTGLETGSSSLSQSDSEPESLRQKAAARLRRDLKSALIDTSQKPTGDFDLLADQSPSGTADRVSSFNGLITTMRLATMSISLLLVSADTSSNTASLRFWTAVLVLYAIFRTVRPIKYTDSVSSLVLVIAEVFLGVLAVVATGGCDSPLIFMLLPAITVAGLARGFGFSFRVAVVTILAVSFVFVDQASNPREALVRAASWAGIIMLVAIIAGYTRRISGVADRDRELTLDRLDKLSDANDLLFSLHQVTQTLPASLDMGEVLDTTLQRLHSLVSFESAAVLLFDETDAHWDVVRHEGLHIPTRLGPTDLPVGLRKALAQNGIAAVSNLIAEPGGGLSKRSGSGLYSVLTARGTIIGLLALEHGEVGHFTHREEELVAGFIAPAALAVDNARWFARLRTVGADEERTRIARDLHDRIGQSLAYLGFELDRLVEKDSHGESVSQPIAQLRDDVRGVIREVRDTLYDLRTDVSDERSLGQVLEQYAERVAERSALQVHVEAEESARLPILQEREMWRVTQEALANVERHASATAVRVVWRCDGHRALVDITDNGVGFEQGRAGRLDSYGLLGMRERAASVGASFEIVSAPGRGTRVRCTLQPATTETQSSSSPRNSQIGDSTSTSRTSSTTRRKNV
ncbi:signal transduction histidine kinase [Actinobacteria bacterium IMCC26207]|nr:signal transduction histidine kinase [Actinobacteria bacterium IMCC26207]